VTVRYGSGTVINYGSGSATAKSYGSRRSILVLFSDYDNFWSFFSGFFGACILFSLCVGAADREHAGRRSATGAEADVGRASLPAHPEDVSRPRW
jgi:hypothetical protein